MTVSRRRPSADAWPDRLEPWQKDMWSVPKVDAEYVARMEDVLDLYAERPDPKRPVVLLDEPCRLIGRARQPIQPHQDRFERFRLRVSPQRRRSISSSSSTPAALGAGSGSRCHRAADDFAFACAGFLMSTTHRPAPSRRPRRPLHPHHTLSSPPSPPAEARPRAQAARLPLTRPSTPAGSDMVAIRIGVSRPMSRCFADQELRPARSGSTYRQSQRDFRAALRSD